MPVDGIETDSCDAARRVPASRVYATEARSRLREVDAAIDDGQWSISIAASLGAVRSLVLCHLILAGLSVPATEQEIDLHAAFDVGGCADLLAEIVTTPEADRATAESIARQLRAHASRTEEHLPITTPCGAHDPLLLSVD